ncbi:uncharacterized protein LOC115444633 isoform X2 [Manduca sexta]|uniref:uncharacterized protein LOC115444633 isoform X2 n=1 Tax=Manduca sexta TaxID=7130 RepID=UPI00188FFAA4|nr:uncharacterized protein LOC115444633 isoform X2 [Manduca sexta]XP_037299493.1 uncharacterized protein LOC115444633 isoform X2 [Manduca sexta]
MKLNLSSMKLIIKLLILLILFVILYLISVVLYSARYWPDIYNYVNANITIKRIPTISELNLTEIEVIYTTDYTTNGYDYTTDFSEVNKREVEVEEVKDYSELPTRSVIVDYIFDVEGSTKYVKDIVDESELVKDLNDAELVIRGHKGFDKAAITKSNMEEENLAIVVSWIATIFLKNDQNTGQFDYYCDGALLSNKAVLTGARCVNVNNSTVNPEDLLVVVGKKALSGTGPKEKTYRIIKVIPHENFTIENPVANDLAILMLEEPVVFNVDVRPANISLEMDFDANVEKSATTAWAYNGVLGFLFFEKVQNKTCRNTDFVENTICGTYGLGVPLCPSYGGLFVAKLKDHWNLQGIMYGDPAERGLCFSKDVTYTSLKNYLEWIDVNVNKNII